MPSNFSFDHFLTYGLFRNMVLISNYLMVFQVSSCNVFLFHCLLAREYALCGLSPFTFIDGLGYGQSW